MNTKERTENRTIQIGGEQIHEEDENKITRFLGIWLNNNLKEFLVKTRAQEDVCTTVKSLETKRITLS